MGAPRKADTRVLVVLLKKPGLRSRVLGFGFRVWDGLGLQGSQAFRVQGIV